MKLEVYAKILQEMWCEGDEIILFDIRWRNNLIQLTEEKKKEKIDHDLSCARRNYYMGIIY